MLEFVGFTQQAVYRGMERELAAVEKKNGHLQGKVSLTGDKRTCRYLIYQPRGSHRKKSCAFGLRHANCGLGSYSRPI